MKYALPCSANWWAWENLDNAQTGLHDYFGYLKYGYGRIVAQLSVDIRNKFITRSSALIIQKEREHLFPETYAGVRIDDILERIGMTRDELYLVTDKFRNNDLFDDRHILK